MLISGAGKTRLETYGIAGTIKLWWSQSYGTFDVVIVNAGTWSYFASCWSGEQYQDEGERVEEEEEE